MQHVRAEKPALYIKGLLCSHFPKSLRENSSNMLSLLQENESLIKLVPSFMGWWGPRNTTTLAPFDFLGPWFLWHTQLCTLVMSWARAAVWHLRRTPLPWLLISRWGWEGWTTWRTNCSFRRLWWEEETAGAAQKGRLQAAQHSCCSRTIWDVESWDKEGLFNELG